MAVFCDASLLVGGSPGAMDGRVLFADVPLSQTHLCCVVSMGDCCHYSWGLNSVYVHYV